MQPQAYPYLDEEADTVLHGDADSVRERSKTPDVGKAK